MRHRKVIAAVVAVCLLAGMATGGLKLSAMWQQTQGFRHSAGTVMPPPDRVEKAKVLAASRRYTGLWVAGDYSQMYPLVSPRAADYRRGNKPRFITSLQRQRTFPAYHVPPTARPENVRLVSIPRPGVVEFFVVSLDEQPLNQFMTGQWPNWSAGDIAIVEFSLQKKEYRQVWEREPSGSWLCLNLPLDLDDATAKELHFGPALHPST